MAARRRHKSKSFTLTRSDAIRYGLIAAGTLLAVWQTIAVSGANLMRTVRPDMALTFRPSDARAQAKAADLLIPKMAHGGSSETAAEARRLATEALSRDVTIPSAWRMLAMTSQNPATISRLFHISESVSRRDLPTQLWLIEEAVQRNDIPGALRHYDIALRASPASYDILFPILINATGDRGIVTPLGRLLQTSPPWRAPFLERLSVVSPQPDNLARLIEVMGPVRNPREQAGLAGMVRRLSEERQFQPAGRIYAVLTGAPINGSGLIRNGGFEQPNRYPPYQWQIETGPEVGADVGSNGSSAVLRPYADTGLGGVVARQLLILPPGRYRLVAQAGPDADSAPATLYWRVACGDEDETQLAETDFPSLGARIRSLTHFQVPEGCSAQWLQIGIRPDSRSNSVRAWVDNVIIDRIS